MTISECLTEIGKLNASWLFAIAGFMYVRLIISMSSDGDYQARQARNDIAELKKLIEKGNKRGW